MLPRARTFRTIEWLKFEMQAFFEVHKKYLTRLLDIHIQTLAQLLEASQFFFEEGRMSWFYIWYYMWNCDSDRTFVCTTTCLVMTYTVTWTYSVTLSLACIMASPFSGLRNTCKTFPRCFYTDVRHQGTFQKDIGGQFTRQHKVIV